MTSTPTSQRQEADAESAGGHVPIARTLPFWNGGHELDLALNLSYPKDQSKILMLNTHQDLLVEA